MTGDEASRALAYDEWKRLMSVTTQNNANDASYTYPFDHEGRVTKGHASTVLMDSHNPTGYAQVLKETVSRTFGPATCAK